MTVFSRIAWYALWAAVAVAAAGFELDRESRRNTSLAGIVPEPFQGFALEARARGDFVRGDNVAGLQLAREMVARRPIPAEGLAMIARGELAAGREQPAVAAVLLSGERGWRDNFTQAMVVELAVQSGDWEIAAQRLLALWRKGDTSDELRALSGDVLSRPEGLRAVMRQLQAERAWSNAFLLWSASSLDASSVAGLAHTLRQQHAQLNCSSLSAGADSAIRVGHGVAVDALWQAACGSASNGDSARGVGTLLFTPADELIGPFSWRYPAGPGVQQEVVPAGRGGGVHFSNSELIRQPIARRLVLLPPGEHVVRARGDAIKSSLVRGPALSIMCFDLNGVGQAIGKFDLTQDGKNFSLPEECVSQRLEIEVGEGDGTIDFIRID